MRAAHCSDSLKLTLLTAIWYYWNTIVRAAATYSVVESLRISPLFCTSTACVCDEYSTVAAGFLLGDVRACVCSVYIYVIVVSIKESSCTLLVHEYKECVYTVHVYTHVYKCTCMC